jgi:hypothetical protein
MFVLSIAASRAVNKQFIRVSGYLHCLFADNDFCSEIIELSFHRRYSVSHRRAFLSRNV